MTTGSLRGIHIHPIKSCRRIELDEVALSAYGLDGDREWQVVDGAGVCVTQRQHKVLAVLQPELISGGLRIGAPGYGVVEVARPSANDRVARALLGDEVQVADGGDEVAAWLTALLGEPTRLVAITPETQRKVGLVRQQPITFVDAAPVLVVNTASLRDLQSRSVEPFGMERFRPNLLLDCEDAWAEDTWQSFSVGAASLDSLMPWPRCAIPQIDQDTAERGREPAVAMRSHRWCTEAPGYPKGLRSALEGKALFGMGCAVRPEGAVLRIGDALTVHSSRERLIAPPAPVAG